MGPLIIHKIEMPQVNLVMQAEQWKDRLVKEDEAYVKGRTIRKNETQAKLEAQRGRSYMKTQMSPVPEPRLPVQHEPSPHEYLVGGIRHA